MSEVFAAAAINRDPAESGEASTTKARSTSSANADKVKQREETEKKTEAAEGAEEEGDEEDEEDEEDDDEPLLKYALRLFYTHAKENPNNIFQITHHLMHRVKWEGKRRVKKKNATCCCAKKSPMLMKAIIDQDR
jgi:ATP-dependent exoDNAse (exonuclease V) beta subunit